MRDFVFLAIGNQFGICVFVLPTFIDISEWETAYWIWIQKGDSGSLGDAMRSRWGHPGYGDLDIPELSSANACKPLRPIGMKCTELGIPSERPDNAYQRVNPISDSVGLFIFTVDSEWGKTATDDSKVPSLTLSKIRKLPWRRPAPLGYECPSGKRDMVRISGGHHFWHTDSGRTISDHIVTDALWVSSPTTVRH